MSACEDNVPKEFVRSVVSCSTSAFNAAIEPEAESCVACQEVVALAAKLCILAVMVLVLTGTDHPVVVALVPVMPVLNRVVAQEKRGITLSQLLTFTDQVELPLEQTAQVPVTVKAVLGRMVTDKQVL